MTEKNLPETTSSEEDIPADLIEKLPEKEREGAIVAALQFTHSRTHSGPLPLASEFRAYEEVHQGAAARILNYMDKEQDFRHQSDIEQFHATKTEVIRGQILGFLLAALFAAGAFYFGAHGNTPLALAFLAPPAFGVVKHIVLGKK